VNYANEPSQAVLERSSQEAYDVIRLTRAARRLCGRRGAFDRIFIQKEFLFICLFLLSVAYDLEARQKLGR